MNGIDVEKIIAKKRSELGWSGLSKEERVKLKQIREQGKAFHAPKIPEELLKPTSNTEEGFLGKEVVEVKTIKSTLGQNESETKVDVVVPLNSNVQIIESQVRKQTLSEKIEERLEAFVEGKSAADCKRDGAIAETKEYWDIISKNKPKEVTIKGSMDIRSVVMNIGPVDLDHTQNIED